MKPLALVGLDPGTTTAYAVLNLEGEVLKLFSAKELSLAETISQIIEVCQPLITATDKAKLPSFIEEFSRKLGTLLFIPEEDLKREEKRLMVQNHFPSKKRSSLPIEATSKMNRNEHELDSLAAALFAYKKYFPKLAKINSYLSENMLSYSLEQQQEFTKIALKEGLSFAIVKDILTKNNLENQLIQEVLNPKNNLSENNPPLNKKYLFKLYQQITRLKEEKQALETKIKSLSQSLDQLKKNNFRLNRQKQKVNSKIDQLFKFKEGRLILQSQELDQNQKIISQLQQEILSLYSFISSASVSQYQLLKKLADFGQKEFQEKEKWLQIREGDFLLVQKPYLFSEKVLEELKNKNITIIATEKIEKHIRENFTHLLIARSELIAENEHFALLDKKIITSRISQKDFIEQIISEYHQERLN